MASGRNVVAILRPRVGLVGKLTIFNFSLSQWGCARIDKISPISLSCFPVILAGDCTVVPDFQSESLNSLNSRLSFFSYRRLIALATLTGFLPCTCTTVNRGAQKLESHRQLRRKVRLSAVKLIAAYSLGKSLAIGFVKIIDDGL